MTKRYRVVETKTESGLRGWAVVSPMGKEVYFDDSKPEAIRECELRNDGLKLRTSRPKKRILTAKTLGALLHREFTKDGWGDIDPYWFKRPLPDLGTNGQNGGGMLEVLDRVAKKIEQWLTKN